MGCDGLGVKGAHEEWNAGADVVDVGFDETFGSLLILHEGGNLFVRGRGGGRG